MGSSLNQMLQRIVRAVIVGVFVWLICIGIGILFGLFEVEFAVAFGGFITKYASLIALLAALWYFLAGTGGEWWPFSRTKA